MQKIFDFDLKISDLYKDIQDYLRIKNLHQPSELQVLHEKYQEFRKKLVESEKSNTETFKSEISNIDLKINELNKKINQYSKTVFTPDIIKRENELSQRDFFKEYTNIIENSDKEIFDMYISINLSKYHYGVQNFKENFYQACLNFDFELKTLPDIFEDEIHFFIRSSDHEKFMDYYNKFIHNDSVYTMDITLKLPLPFSELKRYRHFEDIEGLSTNDYISLKENFFQNKFKNFNLSKYFNDNIEQFDIDTINLDSLKENYFKKFEIYLKNKQKEEEVLIQENKELTQFSEKLIQTYEDILNLNKDIHFPLHNQNASIEQDHEMDDILSFLQGKQESNQDLHNAKILNNKKQNIIESYLRTIEDSTDHTFDIIILNKYTYPAYQTSFNNDIKLFLEENEKKHLLLNGHLFMRSIDLKTFLEKNDIHTDSLLIKFIPPIPYKYSIEFNQEFQRYIVNSLKNPSFKTMNQEFYICSVPDYDLLSIKNNFHNLNLSKEQISSEIIGNLLDEFIKNFHKYNFKELNNEIKTNKLKNN